MPELEPAKHQLLSFSRSCPHEGLDRLSPRCNCIGTTVLIWGYGIVECRSFETLPKKKFIKDEQGDRYAPIICNEKVLDTKLEPTGNVHLVTQNNEAIFFYD
jgi:hypothetical protein